MITGFLGSGKTTTIRQLLAQKPDAERWAVIVNEFGEIGIDTLAIEKTDELELLPLSGGCVCCRLGPQLHKSLNALLESHSFDRLIIEPTGMGHPGGILDTLLKPYYRDRLEIQAVICLVDPRQLDDESLLKDSTFVDQINMADILVANKADLSSDEAIARFYQMMQGIFPPKQQLVVTQQGQLDLQYLDLVRQSDYVAHTPDAHAHHHEVPESGGTHLGNHHVRHGHGHSHSHTAQTKPFAKPCHPVRYTNEGMGLVSCGWIFHQDDIFDFDELETFLSGLSDIVRLKGVFRLGAAFVFMNRVNHEMSYDAISYRRDSRIEILAEHALDWDAIEAELIRMAKQGVDSPYRNI